MEFPWIPRLIRYLVAELDNLGLAYLDIMHLDNEPLLTEIRKLWQDMLILNRPSHPYEQICSDIVSEVAAPEAYDQMVLANHDFVERLKAHTPMNEAYRATCFGGTAQGYTDYPSMSERERQLREKHCHARKCRRCPTGINLGNSNTESSLIFSHRAQQLFDTLRRDVTRTPQSSHAHTTRDYRTKGVFS